jgi:hypothetical protein
MKRSFQYILSVLLLIPTSLKSQDVANTDENVIRFMGNSRTLFEDLFRSFDTIILEGKGTVNILHLGDSHIQAGYLTGRIRERIVSSIASGCGARGLIFPYRMARTNNPTDYSVKFSGRWESCRNVETNRSCDLGMIGIMVTTTDSITGMTIRFKEPSSDFNHIRIYHDTGLQQYIVSFPGFDEKCKINTNAVQGFTDVYFPLFLKDSVTLRISRCDTLPVPFRLYGLDFMNGDAGIIFSSAGVNGAEVVSFLRCDLLAGQLSAEKPSLVIVSLGTNDAYPVRFDKDLFKQNYIDLIKVIRKSDPKLPVLLTIPGDGYRKRRYVNKNLPVARDAIFEVAQETDCAVWDFFAVMGGAKSIIKWYKAGLAAKDKLHFSKAGYFLQGDLFSDAFLDAYISHIDQGDRQKTDGSR